MAMSRLLMWLKSGQKPTFIPKLLEPFAEYSARRTTGYVLSSIIPGGVGAG